MAARLHIRSIISLVSARLKPLDVRIARGRHCYHPRTLRSDLQAFKRLSTAACLRLALDVVSGLSLASNQIVCTTTNGSQVASADQKTAADSAWTPTVAGISGASPDGRWLAIFPPYANWVQIYELPGLKSVTRLQADASVARVEFSPAGDEVAVSCQNHVGIWSTASWKQVRKLSNAIRLFYMPDGRKCWLVKDYRTAGLYDARSQQLLWPLPLGTLPLAVSSDGHYLAASANARHLQVWDLQGIAAVLKKTGLDLLE